MAGIADYDINNEYNLVTSSKRILFAITIKGDYIVLSFTFIEVACS